MYLDTHKGYEGHFLTSGNNLIYIYVIGKGKALASRLYDFCTIIECQNENTRI